MSGIYSLLSSAKTQERNLEVTSNNIANANTNAFKSDKAIFREFFKQAKASPLQTTEEDFMHDPWLELYSPGNTKYSITDDVIADMQNGSYEVTDSPYDLAIKGNGFFSIQTPFGLRYTKDGAFQRSSDGYLIDAQGNYVQGKNGRIEIRGQNFHVTEEGLVEVDGSFIDQLQIVDFDNASKLTKEGSSYYLPNQNQPAINLDYGFSIKQGMLEASNVILVKEMLDLITAERSFQAAQRGIKTLDDLDEQSLRLAR